VSLEFVIVRNVNESKRSAPKTFMTRDSAEELYEAGLATWNTKHTALTLKTVSATMVLAQSLKPGARVIFAYTEGKPHAVAIINAYRHRYAA
jgi:hypothetical protein